ncbi:Asparagine synthase [Halogranum amylolyticum]|uniref:Asparagine synthase n=1 Tax=Halogranum amylolyticum TaxID=660520 RepID=A0A1H8W418_9EURY|nr:asparagine synthase-related protein [Halogranum amylolyticum]SEP22392.1 Asparagine synthase [Halogranum amylolyticum]
MQNELFGVFGERADFERFCNPARFNAVVETEQVTIGVRDLGYGLPGRTVAHDGEAGTCVIWGEVVSETGVSPAKELLARYAEVGDDAFDVLNGSYLAYVEHGGDAQLVTDAIRSWECYFTDAPGVRVFGTDAANVAQAVPNASLDRQALTEVTHFGVAFDEATVFDELHRVPFDGYLTPEATGELSRFVYDPQPPETFDYAAELAERLERAIQRRIDLPGRKGMLLSAGYDSRAILSQHPNLDVGYTLGTPDSDEVTVAERLAEQYGIDHETLEVTERYLDVRPEVIQYSQGIRESLHIHHRGNNDEIEVDTIYHGMLFDTLFRGFFLPGKGLELFDRTFPLQGLEPEPDVSQHFAEKLGFLGDDTLPDCGGLDSRSADEFARNVIEPRYEACFDRADDPHNAMDLLGVKQKPTLPFRGHLADHYVESFVAVDRELLDWHLKTPPERRNTETFLQALRRLDPDILRHQPPDRPHHSFRMNQIEKFLREKLPVVRSFENPWPDRKELYERNNLDQKLFPGYEEVHSLPPRVKLRMNDLTTWIEFATGESRCTPDQLLRPPSTST